MSEYKYSHKHHRLHAKDMYVYIQNLALDRSFYIYILYLFVYNISYQLSTKKHDPYYVGVKKLNSLYYDSDTLYKNISFSWSLIL